MTDAATHQRLRVSTDGTAGPYIDLPFSQLEDVKELLGKHRIHFWVSEYAISLNGSPETTTINFGRGVDAAIVQHLLDSVH